MRRPSSRNCETEKAVVGAMSSKRIILVEVGPRDGLQSEPEILSTDSKIALIKKAIDAGVTRLEVASFVHPKRVPQMADAEVLIERLPKIDGVSYITMIGLDNIHHMNFSVADLQIEGSLGINFHLTEAR